MIDPTKPDTRTVNYSASRYRIVSVYDDNARRRERTKAVNEVIKKIIKE